MTEKIYGGTTSFGLKEKKITNSSKIEELKEKKQTKPTNETPHKEQDLEKLKKAGQIASQAVVFARSLIKPQMPLLEIAEKIESKIKELGGSPAFPVNLSINEIAAHATPSPNSTDLAEGLLKVDLGVHISGFIADTAFSLDLSDSQENRTLIKAAENALSKALEKISLSTPLNEIGGTIESEIKSLGFLPIQNLSGHGISRYELHSGISIPNYNNSKSQTLPPGSYAIEPFSTLGFGFVKDGKPSGIFELIKEGQPRDQFARQVLNYIKENFSTLPFCSRWIVKKFGSRSLISLKQLEQADILKQFSQLIEKNKGKVAQAEHTIILTENEKIITTL